MLSSLKFVRKKKSEKKDYIQMHPASHKWYFLLSFLSFFFTTLFFCTTFLAHVFILNSLNFFFAFVVFLCNGLFSVLLKYTLMFFQPRGSKEFACFLFFHSFSHLIQPNTLSLKHKEKNTKKVIFCYISINRNKEDFYTLFVFFSSKL